MLITRAADAAGRTAQRLIALGFIPITAPMLAIAPLRATLPPTTALQAVLVTSANALPALDANLHHVKLLAVGDATATRARAAGFRQVVSAAGNAMDLARLVRRECDPGAGALLLPTASGEGKQLAAALRDAGFTVLCHDVYAAVPVAALPAGAAIALGDGVVCAALFYSAAAARTFARLAASAVPRLALGGVDALAIAAAVAVPLAPLPWRCIRVASHPNQDALLNLLTDET